MSDEHEQPKCPKCGSVNWRCWDQRNHVYIDTESDDWMEVPVGYLACNMCNRAWLDVSEIEGYTHMGIWDDDRGWIDD